MHEEFRSSSSALFGKQFGALCVRFKESSAMPLCRLTSRCRIFFPSVSETADGGIIEFIDRNIGESSQVLLWPKRHSTVRGR